jgi:hypothetical protein
LIMRYLAALPLLLAASCSPGSRGASNDVDINDAAIEAQDSVDAYANGADANGTVVVPETETPANDAGMEPLMPPEPGTPGGLPDDRTPV